MANHHATLRHNQDGGGRHGALSMLGSGGGRGLGGRGYDRRRREGRREGGGGRGEAGRSLRRTLVDRWTLGGQQQRASGRGERGNEPERPRGKRGGGEGALW